MNVVKYIHLDVHWRVPRIVVMNEALKLMMKPATETPAAHLEPLLTYAHTLRSFLALR